jgi:hypothetical protein
MIDFPDNLPLTGESFFLPREVEQRSISGPTDIIPRLGGRFAVSITAGPFYAEEARRLLAMVMSAKYAGTGLRMKYPLQWQQSGGGNMQIDGDVTGPTRTLKIKNGTPGFVLRYGDFLSITDDDGQSFFHSVAGSIQLDSDGEGEVLVTPELKRPFDNGTSITYAAPIIEGLVTDAQIAWPISGDKVAPVVFTIEERE